MEPRIPESRRPAKDPLFVACVMLAIIAAFFLLREHWGHVAGWWPYLLLLACPLMHFFMHGGHGHAGRHDSLSAAPEDDPQAKGQVAQGARATFRPVAMDTKNESAIVPALGLAWLTPLYDFVMATTMREGTFRPALVDQAAILPGQDVLDLACGTGSLATMIGTRVAGTKLSGLDADPQVLAIAERKVRAAGVPVHFDHGFSNRLPYADEKFDRVVSSLFFHHLSLRHKRETAVEVLRVLRPGGELHIADWGRATNWLMRALFVPVQLLDGFPNTRDNVSGRLPSILEDAGFVGVSQTRTFPTVFGTLALYRAGKRAVAPVSAPTVTATPPEVSSTSQETTQ